MFQLNLLLLKLPKADRHFSTYIRRKKSTFRFAQVNEIEVYLLLESIDTKKSFGYDKVHPLLLSSAALEIFRPLTHIINLSLKHGIFPDNLKIAKLYQSLNEALVPHAITIPPPPSFSIKYNF